MIADAGLLLLLLLLPLIVLIKAAGDIKVNSSALFNLSTLKPGVREGEIGAPEEIGAVAIASRNEADDVDEKEGGATGVKGKAAGGRPDAGEKNRGVPAAAADDDDAVADAVEEFNMAAADDFET